MKRAAALLLILLACGNDGGSQPDASLDGSTDAPVDATASDAGADAWAPLPPTPATPELWYWHHSYLSTTNASEPAKSEALIDQAVAAGYTGLALWDSAQSYLNLPNWDPTPLKTVIAYAKSKGLAVLAATAPYGYSNDALKTDPNLAEGQRVIGTQYKVVGSSLAIQNSLAPLEDGSFTGGGSAWFKIGDACFGTDTSGRTDSAAAKLSATTANCRLTQAMTLTPWRLYHLRFYVKSAGFGGGAMQVEMLDLQHPNAASRLDVNVSVAPTQGYTQYDFTFNSRESTSASIYMGVWGGFSGTLWVDDISAEETGLINVLRRGGTPLKIYDGATTYAEGADYDPISDPALAASPGNYDYWHAPPAVTLPAGTKLQQGATVSVDSYSVFPSFTGQVGMCLTDPGVDAWVTKNAQLLASAFPPGSGVFMQYDEMRHGNSCELCRSKNLDAGPLFAWNVAHAWGLVSATMPGSRGYVWNDMFDPNMNAHDAYYDVEGDITGSWAGLQPGFVIMNWNVGSAAGLTKSLQWFSGTQSGQPHAFQQIIAGYYDSGDGAASATLEMNAAMGIKGVTGVMYTSWVDDYSQLAAYANAVKAAWPAYKTSAP
ncbi:MAG TPA: hypothetical protein VGH28_33710 [Polyangiaceae bacterium]|jgi:hypothetical protein